ncbi:MAG TPA: SRPBCC domain-containing protein [bacterium]|jgi:uncharacterized protein YndB with AHSA1/START domain|nr:SRPBCC domain-containing protein [bacterium]
MPTFENSLTIPAPPDEVFAAISDPLRLARWWGPEGFSNTFHVCEFKPGGKWSLVMHGPNGGHYPNESVFAEIEPSKRVVVEHSSNPAYRLAITLEPAAEGTTVTWAQTFADPELARRMEPIVVPANAQNLDRLAAEVRGARP